MRIVLIATLMLPLLAACGSTEHKTVIVTPPAGSTTVVDQNGNAHTVSP